MRRPGGTGVYGDRSRFCGEGGNCRLTDALFQDSLAPEPDRVRAERPRRDRRELARVEGALTKPITGALPTSAHHVLNGLAHVAQVVRIGRVSKSPALVREFNNRDCTFHGTQTHPSGVAPRIPEGSSGGLIVKSKDSPLRRVIFASYSCIFP